MKGHEHTIMVCEHGTHVGECKCPSSVKRKVTVACPGEPTCKGGKPAPTKEQPMANTTSTPSTPAAPKPKKLLSVGVPARLTTLLTLLGTLDTTEHTTVRYYNGELRIEEPPEPVLVDVEDD